jgi:hypothetical protein
MLTPTLRAAKGTEHSHQSALFMWANMAARFGVCVADDDRAYTVQGFAEANKAAPLPELDFLFAIHNQGHGDKIRGAQARAEGVKAGVPDMLLPITTRANAGLFIEMKRPKTAINAKGSVSAEQRVWIDKLIANSYCVVVAYGWLDAKQAILAYLATGRN